MTTAVKGWHNWSTGYRLIGDNRIEFIGIVSNLQNIVKRLNVDYNFTFTPPVHNGKHYEAFITIISKKGMIK